MDEYIYSQSVHKDFHGIMSYLIEFLKENYGEKHCKAFFEQSTPYIYKPLIDRIKKNGISEIKKHFERVFEMEQGEIEIKQNIVKNLNELNIKVLKCPAIWHMKENKVKIDKDFCKCSTKLVCQAIAEECGYSFSVDFYQDEGKCIQKFQEVKI